MGIKSYVNLSPIIGVVLCYYPQLSTAYILNLFYKDRLDVLLDMRSRSQQFFYIYA
jgi:hypothetical protein